MPNPDLHGACVPTVCRAVVGDHQTPVCHVCLNIRNPLYELPEAGVLVQCCESCWLTRGLLQLGMRLEQGDPVLVEANREYARLYALLRARVLERIAASEITPFVRSRHVHPTDRRGKISPFPPDPSEPDLEAREPAGERPEYAGEEAPILAGLAQALAGPEGLMQPGGMPDLPGLHAEPITDHSDLDGPGSSKDLHARSRSPSAPPFADRHARAVHGPGSSKDEGNRIITAILEGSFAEDPRGHAPSATSSTRPHVERF
jgi:hypothetical protein